MVIDGISKEVNWITKGAHLYYSKLGYITINSVMYEKWSYLVYKHQKLIKTMNLKKRKIKLKNKFRHNDGDNDDNKWVRKLRNLT